MKNIRETKINEVLLITREGEGCQYITTVIGGRMNGFVKYTGCKPDAVATHYALESVLKF